MLVEWLQPLLEWTGLTIVPFLILLFIIIYVLKGQTLMYDIIYQYLMDYIFNGSTLSMSTTIYGQTLSMNEWLAHSTTIICMCLIVFFGIWIIKWVFKLVGGLFILH